MAKPLLAKETIFEAAIGLLAQEGSDGFTLRNLAGRLQCSLSTLYNQVGKREDLIEQLLEYYFRNYRLEIDAGVSWEQQVAQWCWELHGAFMSQPNLSRLLTLRHRELQVRFSNVLLKIFLEAGFSETEALSNCRMLTVQVTSMVLSDINTSASHRWRAEHNEQGFQQFADVFERSIGYCIAGMALEKHKGATAG